MDRPSRKTKVVNYCEAKDFDDDEDFACVKAPPSKKAKEDVTQPDHLSSKRSLSKSSSQETDSQSMLSQKSRRPLDEKLHERDLEAAITLSLLNNVDGIKDQSLTSAGDVKVQLPVYGNTDPLSPHLSNCSVNSTILGLDEITLEKKSSASRQRKSATKTTEDMRKKIKVDEDYQPKLAPDSESDEDFSEPSESEDEEFTVKKVIKTKKDKVTKNEKKKRPPASKKEKQPSKPKSQTTVSTPVRSPAAAKLAPRRPASSSTVSSKSAVSLSPAGGIPKWNPPGQIGKSPTSSQSPAVKSPGQGLRLGLSRLVRVKPLHPSVASH